MNKRDFKIDGIDKVIIKELMNDARTSILSIAKKIGISSTAVNQRLKKLEEKGLIDSYKMVLNTNVLGYNITAFVGVQLDKNYILSEVVKRLKHIHLIIESHYTSGKYDLLIKAKCIDNKHLINLISELKNIKGIKSVETIISLDEQINRQLKI